ncbi:FecR domain-containing protein [Pseudomonas lopnurensis]|uniref:FecR domain-containing protein n=1 Tax=Pseudomonas lopnurensis TaxID=1477517 RepID=UPI00187AB576|nr:FecR domain-containing protein [Pseudomonas lopnurensis]MBE7373888.1 fec operon regulator FecR [Pseudomonas lopnurensis]
MTAAHGGPDVAEREAIRSAALWYARLASGAGGEAEHRAWQRWHDADPLHRQAWQRIEAVREQFARVPGQLAMPTLQGRDRSRRQVLGGLLLLASAGALGSIGWRSGAGQRLFADYRTAIGERRQFTLADGSQLMLNTNSAVDARFDAHQRLLHLRAGELLVTTAADPLGRPFRVETPHGRIRALGTRFTVRRAEGFSEVAVLEKAVEVSVSATAAPVRLEAGQRLRFSAGVSDRPRANDASVVAWETGSLIAIDRPLGELLAELARYRTGWLRCDPRVAGLKVSGAFPLDDTDRALAALESAFALTVERRTAYWVMVSPRG